MSEFNIKDKVRFKRKLESIGEIHSIDEIVDDRQIYGVIFGSEIKYVAGDMLMPYTGQNSVEDNLVNNNFGHFHDFQKALTYLKLSNNSSIQNNIYAINTSKTVFYAYQYKPLIKFVNSSRRRILICDEVGLGKTIEAGLIMKELDARGNLGTVLIVPPANLKVKWMAEMRNRFGEDFIILHAKEFAELISGEKSFAERYKKQRFIVSMESIRTDTIEQALENTDYKWDLLIVDEAHSLRNKNKQHRVIKALSDRAEAMVFLTATPVHLAESNLFNILNIMDENQYNDLHSFESQLEANAPIVYALNAISRTKPNLELVLEYVESVENQFQNNPIYIDLRQILQKGIEQGLSVDTIVDVQRNLSELHLIGPIYNRTLKKDVHKDRPTRVPHKVEISFSSEEQDAYDEIISGIKDFFGDDAGGALALCGAKQMLSSSLHGHRAKLEKNYELFLGNTEESSLFEESEEEVNDSPLPNFEKHEDSKLNELLGVLHKIKQHTGKVILFAFFKDTLRYLQAKLAQKGIQCYMLHGNVPITERSQLIKSFQTDERFCILLSSRVGSEGIDLQFCDTLINYDLPWNPMELEQRIGRIDRIGQKSKKIHIYNFGMLSTIDDRIISRLYQRIALFEGTIGMLEPIMGDIMSDITKQLFYDELSPEELELKMVEHERIIRNKFKHLKDMENASSELLSLDQYFDKEMENIQKNRRFLSPKQLHQYIAGHIEKNYPQSEISYDAKTQMGSLKMCKDFRRDVRESSQNAQELNAFSYGHALKFTFTSEVAMNNESLHFLNILHPLIKAITKQYRELNQIHNCHYFRLRKKTLAENQIELQPGYYFYFICVGTVITTREASILLPIVLDEELKAVGNSDIYEQIIGLAVEEGIPAVQELEINDAEYLRKAHDVAFSIFKDRFYDFFGRHKAKHELIISRRKESKEYYWTNRMLKVQQRLDTLDIDTASPQIVNMYKGQLRNDKIKMEEDIDNIEAERQCDPAYEKPVYGGIIEVF